MLSFLLFVTTACHKNTSCVLISFTWLYKSNKDLHPQYRSRSLHIKQVMDVWLLWISVEYMYGDNKGLFYSRRSQKHLNNTLNNDQTKLFCFPVYPSLALYFWHPSTKLCLSEVLPMSLHFWSSSCLLHIATWHPAAILWLHITPDSAHSSLPALSSSPLLWTVCCFGGWTPGI